MSPRFLLSRGQVAALGTVLCLAQSTLAAVTVRFDPPNKIVDVGQVFTVDLVADITTNGVVGWGLDLTIADALIVSVTGDPIIGPAWNAAVAPDGDGLAGLAFPNPVIGPDVLLATVTFSADVVGETDLLSSYTAGDLTEGFALDPQGFVDPNDLTFLPGHVVVIPEPGSLALLVLGSLAMIGRRRR